MDIDVRWLVSSLQPKAIQLSSSVFDLQQTKNATFIAVSISRLKINAIGIHFLFGFGQPL